MHPHFCLPPADRPPLPSTPPPGEGLSLPLPSTPPGELPPVPPGSDGGELYSLTPVTDAVHFQDTRYKDGGAHWYRASAVLLRYHK